MAENVTQRIEWREAKRDSILTKEREREPTTDTMGARG
jgi:hypothetical protein